MTEVRFLTAAHVLDLHEMACGVPGRLRLVSEHLLESAVGAAKWYARLHYQAAALFRSLTKNHAFVNGNKRTAIVSAHVFLELNGYGLTAKSQTTLRFVLGC